MEIKVVLEISPNLEAALDKLASALSGSRVATEPKTEAPKKEKAPKQVEAPKQEETTAPAAVEQPKKAKITLEMCREKGAALLNVEGGKAKLSAALAEIGAKNIAALQESQYEQFINLIS